MSEMNHELHKLPKLRKPAKRKAKRKPVVKLKPRPVVREPLPKTDDAIMMFDCMIWPTLLGYTLDHAQSAVFFFNGMLGLVDSSTAYASVESKGIAMRFAVRALTRHAPQVVMVALAIINAYMNHPTGKCIVPSQPVNGKW